MSLGRKKTRKQNLQNIQTSAYFVYNRLRDLGLLPPSIKKALNEVAQFISKELMKERSK